MKKKRSTIVLLLIFTALCIGGYYGYQLLQRELKKRAFKRAIEEGCELVIKKYEEEQDEIAQDVARLMEQMEELDDEEVADELAEIRDELQERY